MSAQCALEKEKVHHERTQTKLSLMHSRYSILETQFREQKAKTSALLQDLHDANVQRTQLQNTQEHDRKELLLYKHKMLEAQQHINDKMSTPSQAVTLQGQINSLLKENTDLQSHLSSLQANAQQAAQTNQYLQLQNLSREELLHKFQAQIQWSQQNEARLIEAVTRVQTSHDSAAASQQFCHDLLQMAMHMTRNSPVYNTHNTYINNGIPHTLPPPPPTPLPLSHPPSMHSLPAPSSQLLLEQYPVSGNQYNMCPPS